MPSFSEGNNLSRHYQQLGLSYYRHIGDPVLAPEIDSNPRIITNLVKQQSLFLSVFDQRMPVLTIDSVVEGDGIQIYGQKSGKLITGSMKAYQIVLDTKRGSSVTGRITWHFKERDSYSVDVSAINSSLWSYRPIWPIIEKFKWSTAVLKTTESEQRIAAAENPIQALKYSYLNNRSISRDLDNKIRQLGKHNIMIPLWLQHIDNISVNAGALFIPVSDSNNRFGKLAALYHDYDHYELITISSQTDTGITLERPVNNNHTNAILVPVTFAISKGGIKSTSDGRYSKQSIEFNVINPTKKQNIMWDRYYLGSPVLERYTRGISHNTRFDIELRITDANQLTSRLTRKGVNHTAELKILSENYLELISRLFQLRGRLRPIWLVSNRNEIVIAKTSAKSQLIIKPIGIVQKQMHLYMKWKNGTIECLKAIPNGVDTDGNEILLIETNETQDIHPTDLMFGHIMTRMRMVSDDVNITHYSKYSDVKFNLIEVPEKEINIDYS